LSVCANSVMSCGGPKQICCSRASLRAACRPGRNELSDLVLLSWSDGSGAGTRSR
jgi:hypothetical protein